MSYSRHRDLLAAIRAHRRSPARAKDRPGVLPGLIEDAPRYRATPTLRGCSRSVHALSAFTRVQRRGESMTLTIDEMHEVMVLPR